MVVGSSDIKDVGHGGEDFGDLSILHRAFPSLQSDYTRKQGA
jgi:hypothetical protein